MKRNLYYRKVFGRVGFLQKMVLHSFMGLGCFFRIPIENIIRKDFGERYFGNMATGLVIIALAIIPYAVCNHYGGLDTERLYAEFTTWYIYLAILIYCSYQRWKEVQRNPSVFDFARFSLGMGEPHSFYARFPFNPRTREIFVEPLTFFLPGFVLVLLQQPLGLLLMVTAIMYGLSYWGAYTLEDYAMMDQIDEILCTRDMQATLLGDDKPQNGVRFRSRLPSDPDDRKTLFDAFLQNDEEIATEVI